MKEEWITSESMGNYSKIYQRITSGVKTSLKSASNLNGNLNCSKELEHYAS